MPMVWDNVADARLFAAVVATCETRLDYKKLAFIMGPECTEKAISHRISKLRAIAKIFNTSADATQTPVKHIRAPKAKAGRSHGEDENDESPSKKRKTAKPRTNKKTEPEPAAEEEDEGAGVY